MEVVLQWLLPFLVGGSLGLIGGGGTVLAVPILIYFFHQEPKSAIGMSLGIVSLVSLLGSFSHWKKGNVKLEKAAFFTPFAMLGAFIGARLANIPQVKGELQMVLFGMVVTVSSILMLLKKSEKSAPSPANLMDESPDFDEISNGNTEEKNPATGIREDNFFSGQLVIEWKIVFLLAAQGLFVGILTGLVGVGGGFLIVPALVFLGKASIREAIGTSLIIIFFNSMSGFIGYVGKVPMDWFVMGKFLILAIFGVLLGVHFGEKVPKYYLQKLFGIFLLCMGLWMIYTQWINLKSL